MIGRKTAETDAYWRTAHGALGLPEGAYHVSTFSHPKWSVMGNSLVPLAVSGQKRGTCHLDLDFEIMGVPRRKVGDYWVVVDSENAPHCLVKVVRIDTLAIKDVGEDFARREGEGDLSLRHWREVHEKYWRRQLETWGHPFSDELVVVCEYFEKLHPA